jgi:excisionase family DNA binding protein
MNEEVCRRHVKAGNIPHIKVGKTYRVPRAGLEALEQYALDVKNQRL